MVFNTVMESDLNKEKQLDALYDYSTGMDFSSQREKKWLSLMLHLI